MAEPFSFILTATDVLVEEPQALSLSPHPDDQNLATLIQRQGDVLLRKLRQRGVDPASLSDAANTLVREMHLYQVLCALYARAMRSAGDRYHLLLQHYERELDNALEREALGLDTDADGVADTEGSGRLRATRMKTEVAE